MEFEFKSNSAVHDLSAVPDFARPFYTEEAGEGGHTLREELRSMADAYDALNKSLKNARREARDLRKDKLEGWLELGENPDAVRAQLEELQAQVKDASKGGVNMDKMKADFEKARKALQEEAETEKAKMRSALQRHMVESQAAQALAAEKGDVNLLMPHVLSQAKLFNEGDDWQVRIVDGAGDPRGDGKGGFMGIPDLVREMKSSKSFGRAFDADNRAGAGSGSNGMDAGRPPSHRGGSERSSFQKIQSGLATRGV